jgi:hypothetical protein
MHVKQALIEAMPRIIAESVKPMEASTPSRFLQVNGPERRWRRCKYSTGWFERRSLADEMVNSALKYRSQAPLGGLA